VHRAKFLYPSEWRYDTGPLPAPPQRSSLTRPTSAISPYDADTSQALTQALTDLARSGTDLAGTLAVGAEAMRSVTGADRATISLYEPDRAVMGLCVGTDPDSAAALRDSAGRPLSDFPLWNRLQATPDGELLIADTVADGVFEAGFAARSRLRSVLGIVIGHPSVVAGGGESVVAHAYCSWSEPDPRVGERELRLARALAAHLAVAIANAHHLERATRLSARLSDLAAWAARISAAREPDEVARVAAQAASELQQAPLAGVIGPRTAAWHPRDPGLAAAAGVRALPVGGGRWAAVRSSASPRGLADALAECGLRYAGVAASAEGSVRVLSGWRTPPGAVEAEVALLLADLAGAAVRSAATYASLAAQAVTDSLTGLGNRRAFESRLDEEMAHALRYARPLALCLVDVDHFRDFNERGGHAAGDGALRLVGASMRSELRGADLGYRIGGDEFALILPETTAERAAVTVRRLAAAVSSAADSALTITAGVAQAPDHGTAREQLYRAADAALYVGKRGGRDQVYVATASG
jgi:diguanylate cyclase (GGDEF)-like protein